MSPPESEVTLGELGRRVDRLDTEMQAGFRSMREEIQRLAFVPAAVYAADRSGDHERLRRLEQDLSEETEARRTAEQAATQRAWQARWSLILAAIGVPFGVVASVLAGIIVARLT